MNATQRSDATHTSVTLLSQVRDQDQQAWNYFVERYAPRILGWCRQYRLQESDAADVTQEVLIKLVAAMRNFDYESSRGTFRGWLKTVTTNTIRDLLKSWRHRNRGSGGTVVQEMLASVEAPQTLADHLALEHREQLPADAETLVRQRVKDDTWRAYQLTAVKQIPADEAPAQLETSVAQVYVAKSRVIKMLRQEVERLEARTLASLTKT